MNKKASILVAPLNWGLGHATRCIPIIRALLESGHKVLLGSDGAALELLTKEFPSLDSVLLPSYDITYASKGEHQKRKLFLQSPRLVKAIQAEHKLLKTIIETHAIKGVISDNRLGLYTKKVPTVFITHQLNVLSGNTTRFTTYIHQRFIKKFNACWVPDFENSPNLSGLLGHPKKISFPIDYIGPISRFQKEDLNQKYDALVLLSGPEPQRSLLEEILLEKLKKYNGSILFVRGVIEEEKETIKKGNFTIVNYMEAEALEKAINSSKLVISRSGYTTIMDLAVLGKKAFFIPTPGQPEQEYLAMRLNKKGIVPFAHQDEFKVKDLAKVPVYRGFDSISSNKDLGDLFSHFKGKRELRSDAKLTFDIDTLVMSLYNMLYNR